MTLRGGEGEASRGAALVGAGWQTPTRVLLVRLHLLESAAAFARRTAVSIHLGTASTMAHVTLVAEDALAAGATAVARVSLRESVAAYAGQAFVVRRSGRGRERTVGGGNVLDPHPRRTRGRIVGAHGSVVAMIDEAAYVGIDAVELRSRLAVDVDAARDVDALVASGAIVHVADRFYPATLRGEAAGAALAAVRAFHLERPTSGGVMIAELETRVPPRIRALVPLAVASLVSVNALTQTGAVVRDAGREGFDAVSLQRVYTVYARAGLAPPRDEEARAASRLTVREFRDALVTLKHAGKMHALGGGLHIDIEALTVLKSRVRAHFTGADSLAPGTFKELAGGLSRKHAIPLLEWLDAQGVTKRRGDVRVAGPAIASG